jgi:hypothetical protein
MQFKVENLSLENEELERKLNSVQSLNSNSKHSLMTERYELLEIRKTVLSRIIELRIELRKIESEIICEKNREEIQHPEISFT